VHIKSIKKYKNNTKKKFSLQKKMDYLLPLLFAIAIFAISFILLSVRIILHKSHRFPETSAGHNKEMRRRGITCPRHDEIKCWSEKKEDPDCKTCFEHARD
jgi:hypothetical protein